MPYASDKQRRFMHARHPGIAARWDAEIHEAKRKKRIEKRIEKIGVRQWYKGLAPREKKFVIGATGVGTASVAATPFAAKHSLFGRQKHQVTKSLAELGEIAKGLSPNKIAAIKRKMQARTFLRAAQNDPTQTMTRDQVRSMAAGDWGEVRMWRHTQGRDAAKEYAARWPKGKQLSTQERLDRLRWRKGQSKFAASGKQTEQDLIDEVNRRDIGRY